MTLHLVLTYYWWDAMAAGIKDVEYRLPTSRWMRLIYDRRLEIDQVCYHRAYTTTTMTRPVLAIDLGPCPYPEWEGEYIRIHHPPSSTGVGITHFRPDLP